MKLDRSILIVAALAVASGVACYALRGMEAVEASLHADLALIANVAPRLGAGFFIAAFVQALLSRDWVARHLGDRSGVKGLVVATGAGMITPGGPMTAFPVVASLRALGTARGPLVVYLTSWSTLGFQRILVWEIPLMGPEFALLRWLSTLLLAPLAGLIARVNPIRDRS